MEIRFIDSQIERFILSLEKPIIAKVLRTTDLLEKFGNRLGLPHSKNIGPRLFELRIRGKTEVRILYTFHDNQAVFLHAFVKKTSSIPKRELYVAQRKLRMLDDK